MKKRCDQDFLDWLSYLPSAIDGAWSQWDSERGIGRNIACHVRRVSHGAGMGIKPLHNAIPLTTEQHSYQHQHGEKVFLEKYQITSPDWFQDQADRYYMMYIRHLEAKKKLA